MRKFGKKTITAVAAAIAAAGISVGAYAYWTTTGAGTGTAAVGTANSIVVNQTSILTGIAPGVAPQNLSGTFTNSGSVTVHVTTVSVVVSGTDKPTGTNNTGCTPADFKIAGTSTVTTADVLPNSTGGAWGGLTIEFNNTAANQDSCKDSIVRLTYTAS